MKKIFLFLISLMALASVCTGCRDRDHIPSVDKSAVSAEYLLGGWRVTDSHVYWKLTAFGTSLNNIYNFKKIISDNIKEETADHSIFFNSYMAFYIRHRPDDIPPYVRQSEYSLNADSAGYIIKFANKEFLSFYAPMVYMKKSQKSDNELIIYLRRGEVLDMLEADGSIGSSYMSMIRSNVEDAVVEIYLERNTLPIYNDIVAQYGY